MVRANRWPSFEGERWTSSGSAAQRFGLEHVHSLHHSGISTKAGVIHAGGNSGYGAVGLCVQWGVSRIVLLGYDMQRTGGRSHWHGDHPQELGNGNNHSGWARRFDAAKRDLDKLGVVVVNATRKTALTCFELVPLEAALNG